VAQPLEDRLTGANHQIALWEQLDGLARLFLLNGRAISGTVDDYVNSYVGEVRGFTDDKNDLTLSLNSQGDHIRLLQDAGIALLFLLEGEVYSLPLRDGFMGNRDSSSEVISAIGNLKSFKAKQDELLNLLNRIRDLLNAALINGDFKGVETLFKAFEDGERLDYYATHADVVTLYREFEKHWERYQVYRSIADQIETAFQTENWALILSRLTELEGDEATTYMASAMPEVSDQVSNKPLVGTREIRKGVTHKQQELNALHAALSKIIDASYLVDFDLAWDAKDNSDYLYDHLKIVVFQRALGQVNDHRAKAQYKLALELLDHIQKGKSAPLDGDGLGYYEGKSLALESAAAYLQKFRLDFDASNLSSKRALKIHAWALYVLDMVNGWQQDRQDCIREIQESKNRFEIEKSAFLKAAEALDGPTFNAAQRRARLLELQRAYYNIKGGVGDGDPGKNGGQSVNPIAPGYAGLDAYYAKYEKDIRSLSNNNP
jgi:hypothetical protein